MNRRVSRVPRWFLCLLCVLSSLSAASNVFGADDQRAKRLLMISTGSRFSVGFPVIEQSALDRLRQLHPGELEVYAESLDIVRFPSDTYQRVFRDYLRDKYAGDNPDLIIFFYVGNLSVAEKLFGQLFPATPVVAAGLTEEEFSPGSINSRFTGIAQSSDPKGTIELVLRLQPEIRRIVLIGGTAPVDRQVTNRAIRASRSFAGRIQFEVWDNRSTQQILKAVTSLPPQTAILFTRMFRDGAGRAINSSTAAQLIAQSASVPVYGMTDTMFGSGAVGGAAVDIVTLGMRAGELAHRVLGGAEPASLPLEIITNGVPIFDWRALKRWGISENRLPRNSVVRFQPVSMWTQYKSYILTGLIIIALQTGLIAALLLQRARRRRAESALSESRQFMELATEAGGIGLWVRDLGQGELWGNPRARSLFGFGHDEPIRIDDLLARIHPDDRARMTSIVERAQETGAPFDVEFRTAVPAVPERWMAARGQFVYGPQGRVLRRMGTMIDITERKRAEEKLRESEENFRRLVETTTAIIWQADSESWMFTYVAPQAVKLLGYPLEQWYEKDFWVSHIHPDDREQALDTCLAMSKTSEEFDFEYRMISLSGEVVWVHDVVSCQHQDGKLFKLRGLMLDVTERKRSEQAIRESEQRFRTVANAAPVMIWISGADKLCTFFNKGWLDFTGRALEQELGNGWAEGVYREDFDRCIEIYTDAFNARQEFTMEYRLRRFDGEYCWVLDHGVPRSAPDGEFLGYIGCAIDIGERKRGELEMVQRRAELAHIARVATMGELAASLAHELNQPLTAILSNAQAAQRFLAVKPPDLEELQEIMKDIVQDDSRAGEVIRRMRSLVKKEELQFAPLDLGAVIDDVVLLAHSDAILHNIRVLHEIDPGLPQVRGDRVQLQQVVLNLLINAFDAMEDCPAKDRQVSVSAKPESARLLRVAVRDRGTGLTIDQIDKVFQPFYTTKREGLGMGLVISRSIIEAHGGRLWAKNNPDLGMSFCFTLPVETADV